MGVRTNPVIASFSCHRERSEAIQGLLRRFAPRNDEAVFVQTAGVSHGSEAPPYVLAALRKGKSAPGGENVLLVMTLADWDNKRT